MCQSWYSNGEPTEAYWMSAKYWLMWCLKNVLVHSQGDFNFDFRFEIYINVFMKSRMNKRLNGEWHSCFLLTSQRDIISDSSTAEVSKLDAGQRYCFMVAAFIPSRPKSTQQGAWSNQQCTPEGSSVVQGAHTLYTLHHHPHSKYPQCASGIGIDTQGPLYSLYYTISPKNTLVS